MTAQQNSDGIWKRLTLRIVADDNDVPVPEAELEVLTPEVTETPVVAETSSYNSQRMAARARRIAGGEDSDLVHRRLLRSNDNFNSAGLLAVNGTLDELNLTFDTSARQIAGYALAIPAADVPYAPPPPAPPPPAGGFDIWAKGEYTRAHVDGDDVDMDVWMIHTGVDYLFNDDLVVGILGQIDISDEDDGAGSFSGTGWLAGPYAAFRLTESLVVDGRAAWGQSYNKVSPSDTYTDDFDADRWLVRGQVTGDFVMAGLSFTPFAQVVYFEETQERYTDSLNNTIPKQTIALGQLRFAPEVSYRFTTSNGLSMVPKVSVSGIWDFVQPDVTDTSGNVISSEDVRARVDVGLMVFMVNGMSLNANGFYDGLGSGDLEAYGGSLQVSVPLL